MAARVQILSDITTVIALLDGLEQLAKVNCYIYAFRNAYSYSFKMHVGVPKQLNGGLAGFPKPIPLHFF